MTIIVYKMEQHFHDSILINPSRADDNFSLVVYFAQEAPHLEVEPVPATNNQVSCRAPGSINFLYKENIIVSCCSSQVAS